MSNQRIPSSQMPRRNSNLTSTSTNKPQMLTTKDSILSDVSDQQPQLNKANRGSFDQSSVSGGNPSTRRSSVRSNQQYPDLPPAKPLDNFLSNTQKRSKQQMNPNKEESKNDNEEVKGYIEKKKSSNSNNDQQDKPFQDINSLKMEEKMSQDKPIINDEQDNYSNNFSNDMDLLNLNGYPETNKRQLFSEQLIKESRTAKFGGEDNKILSLRFDPTDEMIACGSQDGIVRIISEAKGLVNYTLSDVTEKSQPATCVRWRPVNALNSVKNTLLVSYAGGKCLLWHATSSKILARYDEESNDLNTCEFTQDGNSFITAGSDAKIRLYDVGRKAFKLLQPGSCSEHKNRVFASKFADQNLLLTAGWDQNVLLWDMRTHKTCGYIYGPMICGDSLDCKENTVLTGSWRADKQLQLWDIRKTSRVMGDILWEKLEMDDNTKEQSFIYSCQFSKHNSKYIMAGSTGTYEMRLFDREDKNKCIAALTQGITKGVFALDFANNKPKATYGTSDGRWACANID